MTSIYLVDDHAMLRDGLRAVLEDAGHAVLGESGDPTVALGDVLRLRPQVVLLDLNLGQRSGFELLEQLQRRRSEVRVVVLTMSAQPRDVAEAMRLGASGYVLKGSRAAEVLKAVETVAQGRRHLGEGAAELAALMLSQPGTGTAGFAALSVRERQVIRLVVQGRTSAAIAEALHLSPKTVDSYRSRSMAKLGVADVPALVKLAIREGLVGLDEA